MDKMPFPCSEYIALPKMVKLVSDKVLLGFVCSTPRQEVQGKVSCMCECKMLIGTSIVQTYFFAKMVSYTYMYNVHCTCMFLTKCALNFCTCSGSCLSLTNCDLYNKQEFKQFQLISSTFQTFNTLKVSVYLADLITLQNYLSQFVFIFCLFIQVLITVLDENDSPPTFAFPVYRANISEEARSGSPVTRLTAHDADTGSNAQISYSIVSGNDGHFTVDPDTGQIWTSGQLDRETMATYTLVVRASDGRQSRVATLEVSIQDVNDNDPVFTKSTYSFSVPENHDVGTVVDAVTATDPDTGTNGEVVYSIVAEGAPGEDIFRMDSLTGEFTLLSELDFEEVDFYSLIFLTSCQL